MSHSREDANGELWTSQNVLIFALLNLKCVLFFPPKFQIILSAFFFLLFMFIGNARNFYILDLVWLKGFYVFSPFKTISSICWMGWTTISCSGSHPFSSVSSNKYLYFTYSWSSRMWPKLNTGWQQICLDKVEAPVQPTIGSVLIYLVLWLPVFCWCKFTKERKISHIYTSGMLQVTKRFNLYWIFVHNFNN